jgi:hypothetical protein
MFDIGSVALYVLFFCLLRSFSGVNGHVVHVYCQPLFSDFIGKYRVYHCLEGGWGVGEPKEHYSWFE